MPPLVALEEARVVLATRAVLDGVTLAIEPGQRIGVVGRNGDGKSTLLRVLAGERGLDGGRVVRSQSVASSGWRRAIRPGAGTVRDRVVGDRAEHEWAADPRLRGIVHGLLGSATVEGLCRRAGHADGRAVRRGATAGRAGRSAGDQRGRAAARRAHQPPGPLGRGVAGDAPDGSATAPRRSWS